MQTSIPVPTEPDPTEPTVPTEPTDPDPSDQLPEAPSLVNRVFAYNSLPIEFSDRTVNYEPSTGHDTDWYGRYEVNVATIDNLEEKHEVGMVAAYSQIHSSALGLSTIGQFDFVGSVVVTVKTDFAFDNVDIRPFSYEIKHTILRDEENTIQFTLTRPVNISIEFDGDTCKNLMLFSSYLRDFSQPSADFVAEIQTKYADTKNIIVVPTGDVVLADIYSQYASTKQNVIIFQQGLTFLKDGANGRRGIGQFYLPSNAECYVHGDAAVYGYMRMENVQNVHFSGRGYISGQEVGYSYVFRTYNSKNVVIEGIIMYHSYGWTNIISESQDVTMRDVKVAGQRRNNNDAFDICSSSDILVDNCFIRTIDDCITIKGRFGRLDTRMHVENIVVQNTVLWNYQGGNGIVVGSESCTDYYNNIIFRNIDIIHNTTMRAIAMELLDSAAVTNVVFDDIRMELDNDFKGQSTHNYYNSSYSNGSRLIDLELMTNAQAFYGTDANAGSIDGVIFNNITFNGNDARKIRTIGAGSNNMISNVQFNKVLYNGEYITESNKAKFLDSGNYYQNITFTNEKLYFAPNERGIITDDKGLVFSGNNIITAQKSNAELTGGGYKQFDVRLTDTLNAKFNVASANYYNLAVNLALSSQGGIFAVYYDGNYIGTVNTYSLTSEWLEYYLPLNYITAGEHTLSFKALSLPNVEAEGYMLKIGVDYINLTPPANNFIEFETLSSSQAVIAVDGNASGGFYMSLNNGANEATFTGNIIRARGAVLRLTYLAAPDKGIFKVYHNNSLISSDIDAYSATPEFREVTLSEVYLDEGEYTLKAAVIGKNPLSSGYGLGLDCILTSHLAVSKIYKSGYEGVYGGVTATGEIAIDRGYFLPMTFTKVKTSDTITTGTTFFMPIEGVFKYTLVMEGFNASNFEIFFDGAKQRVTVDGNRVSFVAKSARQVGHIISLRYIGASQTSFKWHRTIIDVVEIDKEGLTTLVNLYDRLNLSQYNEVLVANFEKVFADSKAVLFDNTSTQQDIDLAEQRLLNAYALLTGSDTFEQYYEFVAETDIEVQFFGASEGDLAILHINYLSGDNIVSTQGYARVQENGIAVFEVEVDLAGKDLRLVAEIAGKSQIHYNILLAERIAQAELFEFSTHYLFADTVPSFVFDSLNLAHTLELEFDGAEQGSIAKVELRDITDKLIEQFFVVIDNNGKAIVNLEGREFGRQIYVTAVVQNSTASLVNAVATNALLDSTHIGKTISGGDKAQYITVSSTVATNASGEIEYAVNCG